MFLDGNQMRCHVGSDCVVWSGGRKVGVVWSGRRKMGVVWSGR